MLSQIYYGESSYECRKLLYELILKILFNSIKIYANQCMKVVHLEYFNNVEVTINSNIVNMNSIMQ